MSGPSEPSWRQATGKTSELNDVWVAMFRLRDSLCDLESKLTYLDRLDDDRAARPASGNPPPGGTTTSPGVAEAEQLYLTSSGQASQSSQGEPHAKTPPEVAGLRPGVEIAPGDGSGVWRLCSQCGRQYDSQNWWPGKTCSPCYRRRKR